MLHNTLHNGNPFQKKYRSVVKKITDIYPDMGGQFVKK
jgi:hypothetical protein